MSALNGDGLVAVRTVGGLIPADLLGRVVAGDDLAGLSGADFELELGLGPREAANRAWSVLRPAWAGYREALAALGEDERATSLTRDRWLRVLLRELGFALAPQRAALVVDERPFAVSHLAGPVAAHLLGRGVLLDRRTPGVVGAAERPPHALMQEFLNRSDAYLWGIVANDTHLRLLRDSASIAGQAYVEFDLHAIFEQELFSDFVALFLLAHRTRFQPLGETPDPSDCWLERWRADAAETGARALGALREGVRRALEHLGGGFLNEPANAALRRRVEEGELSLDDVQRALLRVVYRLLFCFVAEDRGLLLDPAAAAPARERYERYFSLARLRRVSHRRRGTAHHDLWRALTLVFSGLGRAGGRPELGLPGLGGLFERGASDLLDECELDNRSLLAAVRDLSLVRPDARGPVRPVDYRHLGAEELGGIYEGLLEFVPRWDSAARRFSLVTLSGNERKSSGSYYTPAVLIDCLLDSTLDPLLDEAEAAADPEAALLALTVCDPACGSGHFLLAAARRIAQRLARVRAAGGEPTPEDTQAALHAVVDRCIHGVDVNPLAAELAKVSLWLEALQPGRPLSALDGHIRVGNALLGTTPALLDAGLPDEAFAVLEGDERKAVSAAKKRNRAERRELLDDTLFADAGLALAPGDLGERLVELERQPVGSLADVQLAERRRRELEGAPAARRARFLADAWCAAFVAPKRDGLPAITTATLRRWAQVADAPPDDSPDAAVAAVRAAAREYRFFHWHLEFPTIFDPTTGEGGFDCVVGNPPWEHQELKEKEFFATRAPEIADASGARRKTLIAALGEEDPALSADYHRAKRAVDGTRHFLGKSGRFPLCGRGRINSYAVFAEHGRSIVGGHGRFGIIVPTGIATDDTTQHYFRALVESAGLVSLYDFENRAALFPAVDSRVKFCLLTQTGRDRPSERARFAFFLHHPRELVDPERSFELTPGEILLVNPNTGTSPIFRSRRDAEITLGIYRRVPVLVREGDPAGNPWGVSFMQGLFNMTSDSDLFHTRDELEAAGWRLAGNVFHRGEERMLPLYEGKMIHHFDHRWATHDEGGFRDVTDDEKRDPGFAPLPRYWVADDLVRAKLAGRWDQDWLIGFRDITNTTNERTMIAAAFPYSGVGNNLPIMLSHDDESDLIPVVLSSLVADFAARLKVGGTHMNFFIIEQVPVLAPAQLLEHAPWCGTPVARWIRSRTAELIPVDQNMASFPVEAHPSVPPRWDPERRAILRAELDAAFFHLYGVERDDVDYILGTFPIVNRKDRERFGEERTRRLILENYDALAAAIATGEPFVSTLDPPPGDGPRHPAREESAE